MSVSTRRRIFGAPVVDLVIAGMFTVLAVVETASTSTDDVWLRTLLTGATAAPLAWRRSAPAIAALGVSLGLTALSLMTEPPDQASLMFVVIITAFSVAASAAGRDVALGLGAVAIALSLSIAVDRGDTVSNIPPTIALFIVLPAVLGVAFRRRGLAVAQLELRIDSAEESAANAVEDERRRIARELHDVVSHAVTLISVQAEAAQATLDTDTAATRRHLERIGTASRDALGELHALLGLLHEPANKTEAGLGSLPALVEGVRAASVRVTVSESGQARLPADVDHCAYRVVQEGLTNALRHSRDPRITIQIDRESDGAIIQITSTGTRHQSAYGGSGRGLTGLTERVRLLGGDLSTTSDGDIHTLTATFPGAAQ